MRKIFMVMGLLTLALSAWAGEGQKQSKEPLDFDFRV